MLGGEKWKCTLYGSCALSEWCRLKVDCHKVSMCVLNRKATKTIIKQRVNTNKLVTEIESHKFSVYSREGRKRGKKNQGTDGKQKNRNKIIDLYTTISINTPVKRQRLSD